MTAGGGIVDSREAMRGILCAIEDGDVRKRRQRRVYSIYHHRFGDAGAYAPAVLTKARPRRAFERVLVKAVSVLAYGRHHAQVPELRVESYDDDCHDSVG
jgi:hypothetical protein